MYHLVEANERVSLGSLAKGGQVELISNENKYNCPTCGKTFKKVIIQLFSNDSSENQMRLSVSGTACNTAFKDTRSQTVGMRRVQ